MVVAALACAAVISLFAPCASVVVGPILGVVIVEVIYSRAVRRMYDVFASDMQCTSCGYPLHGHVVRAAVGTCPECGTEYDAATYDPPGGTDALQREYEQHRMHAASPPPSET